MLLKQFPTICKRIKGFGTFDVQNIDDGDNSISLCIPFKEVECVQINQYIEESCNFFKNEHPKSNHSYFQISLTINYSDAKTNVTLFITITDDILEEMEIYSIPLKNTDILNRHTKNLFKKMILKELDKVLSF